MNTLPLPALLPQQAAQPAAALLAVLAPSVPITALGAAAAAPAPAQPGSFDRTLQLLLNAAAALPTPGSAAPALAAPAQDDTDTSAADAGTALQFDPALASLQPPPAIAVPLPAVLGTPAEAPPRPAAAAAATVAVQAATGAAPALPASVAAPTPAAVVSPLPAAKPQAAPADSATTSTTALPLERPSVAAGLVPAAASAPQDSVEPRTGEAAPQGRAPSLMQQLGDRIAVQIERGSERVVIRLDPPHRGQIEIHIRQDASGTTQVQLSASHGDVVRQLQAIGDGLRQELAQRQGGDVSVQVAQQQARGDAEGRQRQGEQRQQQPGRALDEQSEAGQHFAHFALATDRS